MSLPKRTDFIYPRTVFLLALLFAFFASGKIAAQVPASMQYQLQAVDVSGKLLFNQDVILRTTILYDTLENTVLYQELHRVNSGSDGFLRLRLGEGENISGQLDQLPWAEGPFFLQTELAFAEGENFIRTGLTQFGTVPFAYYSNIAYDLAGGEPNIPDGTSDGGILYQQSGTYFVLPRGAEGQGLTLDAAGDISWKDIRVPVESQNILALENQLVRVEGGTFTMGCTAEQLGMCDDDETPTQTVTLSDFYLSKFEVTQALWESVMGDNPSHFSNCEECPVENVDWNDIQVFLSRLNAQTGLNYRLPTEAEWEFAARGGQAFVYAGGDEAVDVAWYAENASDSTHAVGQKMPNALGLYDMSGNVYEWCLDWYTENYSGSGTNNPQGPKSGFSRIRRGGSWKTANSILRTTNRDAFLPNAAANDTGFRLARSAY